MHLSICAGGNSSMRASAAVPHASYHMPYEEPLAAVSTVSAELLMQLLQCKSRPPAALKHTFAWYCHVARLESIAMCLA